MTQDKVSHRAVVVMALLFLAAIINYVDRGSLSIAAPVLSKDFNLSEVQMGYLSSYFFVTYALFQLASGWLVDRFSVSKVFGAGFLIWALATLLAGFARSENELILCRLLLGVGESVAFPCFAKFIGGNFPIDKRGLPNAVIEAGTKIGPAVGALLGAYLISDYGWRAMFIVMGAASLIWLVPWLIWGPRISDAPDEPKAAGIYGFRDILTCRDAWGSILGAGCYTYALYFLLTWLPKYLVDVRGLSLKEMGVFVSLPLLLSAGATLIAGRFSDRWIERGASPTKARKTVVVFGFLLSMTALPAALAPTVPACFALLCIAYIAFGILASNHWAISQTLAGPVIGKWAGVKNFFGALTGVAAPIVTGYIVQYTGSYMIAFGFTAALALVGAGSYLFIVREVAPIDWAAHRAARN